MASVVLRHCVKCLGMKPLSKDHFQLVRDKRKGRDSFRSVCKPCDNARQREWFAANVEKRDEYARSYYARNKERLQMTARTNKAKRKDEANAYTRSWRASLKAEMFAAYGGSCACCGETEPRFLTLEHSKRDGGTHRRALGGQAQVYSELKRLGWPKDGFELLCWNCQMATRLGDICPHGIRTTAAAA